jgi:porin
LVLYESQFQWHSEKGDPGLAGKFKLGGWRNFGSFEDECFDTAGLSLASPASTGLPASFAGDYGVYAVFEQKLLRVHGDVDRGIGVFARASYSPPDRNLIDLYADGGLELVGLADAYPKDKFGLAVAYAPVSPRAQALDQDFQSLYGPPGYFALPRRFSRSSINTKYAGDSRCSPTCSTYGILAEAERIRSATCRACR